MNTIAKTLIFTFLSLTALAARAQSTFPNLASSDDVESVYVSEAMLRMVGASGGNITAGVNMPSKMINKITSIEVYSCETPRSVKAAKSAVSSFLEKNPGTKLLVSVNDKSEKVNIYGVPNGKIYGSPNGKTVGYSKIIICDSEPKEYDIVILNGKFDSSDLGSITNM